MVAVEDEKNEVVVSKSKFHPIPFRLTQKSQIEYNFTRIIKVVGK